MRWGYGRTFVIGIMRDIYRIRSDFFNGPLSLEDNGGRLF